MSPISVFSQILPSKNPLPLRRISVREPSAMGSTLIDSKGFIWINTAEGLAKYDGHNFSMYLQNADDSIGYTGSYLTSISEDSSGTIWVVMGLLVSIDRKTGRETWYRHDTNDNKTISSDNASLTFVDSRGRLWIGFNDGALDLFDPVTKTFKHFDYLTNNYPEYKEHDGITKITEKEDGCLIVNHAGFWRAIIFDPKTGGVKEDKLLSSFSNNGYFLEVPTDNVYKKSISIYNDTINNQLIILQGTPYSYSSKMIKADTHRNCFINMSKNAQLLYRGEEKYWYKSFECGWLELDFMKMEISWIQAIDDQKSTSPIRSISRSRNGTLFVSTGLKNSLYVLDKEQNSFRSIKFRGKTEKEGPAVVRTVFIDDKQRLWAGISSGFIFGYDSLLSSFVRRISFQTNLKHPQPTQINRIVQDKDSRLWVTVRGGTIYYSEPPYNKFARPAKASANYSEEVNSSTWGAITDSDGIVWAGYMSYDRKIPSTLLRIDPFTFQINSYRYLPDTSSYQGFIPSVIERDRNSLWVGTKTGIYIFDKKSRKFGKNYTHKKDDKNSISEGAVWVLFRDSKNRLWLSTEAGGLDLFNEKEGTFTHFTKKDGLPRNTAQSILEDSSGRLWIGTLDGIVCFDPDTRIFTKYPTTEDLSTERYMVNSATASPTGEFFFGGATGVTSFFPNRLKKTVLKYPFKFTNIKVSDSLWYRELTNGDTINLKYSDNYFSLDVSYLDYKDPSRKRYEYILEGFDKQWIKANDRRTFSYNNVEPGNYVFRVRVYVDGEKDIQNEIFASIIISPPYWGTWWFRICIGLLVVGGAVYFIRRRDKKRKQYLSDIEAAREKERFDLASELHDGPLQDLYATRFIIDPILSQVDANAYKLDELLQKVRSDLRTITSELQIPRFDLGFAEELRLYIDTFKEKYPDLSVSLEIDNEKEPIDSKVMYNLFRIFRTALVNTGKHADATEVKIQFRSDSSQLRLVIADNGKGFAVPSDFTEFVRTKHYGLFMMKSFADAIGASCSISSTLTEGTTVSISL